jgi:molecular chaperone DnaK
MIRSRLKQLSGRTLNTALSPDLSIAQGATYYAGMLLAHDKFARSILNEDATERLAQVKQQSVNARELGILVRDMPTQTRVPHYLIPPNTPLPTAATEQFGTVVPNQKRVHLVIVESGTDPEQPYVVLGDCKIDGLPANLPEGSKVDVTISYDPQARVHVSAKDAASGKSAMTEILRQENIVAQLTSDPRLGSDSVVLADKIPANPFKQAAEVREEPQTDLSDEKWTAFFEKKEREPVALCNACGTPLGANGKCLQCSAKAGSIKTGLTKPSPVKAAAKPSAAQPAPAAAKSKPSKPASPETIKTQKSSAQKPAVSPQRPQQNQPASPHEEGEDDFWKFVGE